MIERHIWLTTLVVLAAACPNNVEPPGQDTGTDMAMSDLGDTGDTGATGDADASDADMPDGEIIGSRALSPEQAGISPDGASEIDEPLAAAARAGRIQTDDTGFRGLWSHCKRGDFKLYNDRIEACISNELSNRYETFAGGGLLDVRVVGQPGDDVFDLYVPKIGFNAAHPETVRVVRDGSDEGPAVVRAEGTDMPAAYFVGVAGDNLFRRLNLDVSVEYRLAPGADFIEILTFVTNDTDVPAMVQKGDLLAFGDRADVFREGSGFGPGGAAYNWIAAAGAGHAFAWVTPDDRLTSLTGSFGDPPWEITQVPGFVLHPGESFTHFGRFVVSDALDPVVRRAREILGRDPYTPRVVRVVDATGAAVAGRRVEVRGADEAFGGGVTDGTGRVSVSMPDGTHDVLVSGVAGGGGLEEALTVGASDEELEVVVPTVATLELDVLADGAPSPASVTVVGALGEFEGATWGARNRIEVMPGEWTVTVARGPEYDWFTTDVSTTAGEVTTVSATLTRLMDTADWIAADFHQHMEPSSDSRVWVEDRVLDNAGQGVELIVPTDHDVVTDLAPIVGAAGLDGITTTFPGNELSPALSHTNVYPMPYAAEAPGRGAVPLAEIADGAPRRRSVPELIAVARALPTDPVIQLNHARDGSGLLGLVDFDPELGPDAVDHDWWTTDFDAMEVSNGAECEQFRDWAGLWNAGVPVTPIGSSDSHGLWGDVGSKRTWLYMPGTTVATLSPEGARDAVKAGQVVVGTSVFVDFTDGTVPGATLDASSGSVDVGLRVQSANWVGVDTLFVVVNGSITQTVPITPIDATLDFDAVVTVAVTEDSWVSFFASGAATGAYRPSGDRPYAFTGAIRLDVDGGGYASPGVRALDLFWLPLCN